VTCKDLIISFAGLRITPVEPEGEGMEAPPCPIAAIPEEILVCILRQVASLDVGDFARLAQVCKRFAFLIATEEPIWRHVCLGAEVGFGAMHYHWQKQYTWEGLTREDLLFETRDKETSFSTAPTLT
jgi:F-box protein 9